jgi:hypothetical protein
MRKVSDPDQAKFYRTDWTDSRDWKEEIKLQVVEDEKHATKGKLSQSAHGQCRLTEAFKWGIQSSSTKTYFKFFLFCFGDTADKK